MRSVPLISTTATEYGFPYDRRFMLLKPHDSETNRARSKSHLNDGMENMTITYFPELALFLQDINLAAGTFTITYNPPDGHRKSLQIQLEPTVTDMAAMTVNLHGSPTRAYRMREEISDWFSSCFGYDVVLAYLGPERRPVLGNISPNAVQNRPKQSWFSSITSNLPSLTTKPDDVGVTFVDFAPYLVITEESLQSVSSRLSEGLQADVTKFRPNIVLSGASEAWEEDYWGGITIMISDDEEAEVILTANCGRCVSLNVDYQTGQFAKGEEGQVLKKLMKDRRIDKGNKYSPIFGRYGFLKGEGTEIKVGDEVRVSKVNEERTTFGKFSGVDSVVVVADRE